MNKCILPTLLLLWYGPSSAQTMHTLLFSGMTDSMHVDSIYKITFTDSPAVPMMKVTMSDGAVDSSAQDSIRRIWFDPRGTMPFDHPPVAGSGNALDFDGIDDYVRITDETALDITDEITISMWIFPRSYDTYNEWQQLIQKRDYTDAYGALFNSGSANRYLRFYLNGCTPSYVTSRRYSISRDEWQHVALVWDGDSAYIYIDGSLDTVSQVTGAINGNGNDVYLGSRYAINTGDPYSFDGLMDEFRIWNVARSRDDIRHGMYVRMGGSETGLAACYDFDLADGATLTDVTGNGNDGTLVNMDDTDWVESGAVDAMRVDEDDTVSAGAGFDPDGDAISLTEITPPENGSLVLDSADIACSYIPDADFNGADTFAYAVTDSGGAADTAVITVTVNPVADPVTITSAGVDTAAEENVYRYITTLDDPDGDAVTTIRDYPGWATDNGDTLSGIPFLGSHGDTVFTVIAVNGTYADTLVVALSVKDSTGYVPVVLSSFAAARQGGKVMLNWTTESEVDNLGFNVMRTAPGAEAWDKLNAALIPGAGTASEPHAYGFTDADAVAAAGDLYYKLEQVDVNGRRSYSRVVGTGASGPSSVSPPPPLVPGSDVSLRTWPVPAGGHVALSLGITRNVRMTVGVYEHSGNGPIALLHEGELGAGTHELVWDGRDESGRGVPAGTYLIVLDTEGIRRTLKTVIIHR